MYHSPRHLTLYASIGGILVILLAAVTIAVRRHPPADAGTSPARPPAGAAPTRSSGLLPAGQSSGWTLAFSDEFDGTTVDRAKWTDESSAENDGGHGNPDNQQLEYNQAANCTVADGQLNLVARRQAVTAPSGTHYDWSSCLLSSTPSFSFQYGYIEERAILPAEKGFWPAFWTWQAPGLDQQVETDVYELHTPSHNLLLTQHSGSQGECTWRETFDPAQGWHTYGVAITPGGTTWYFDGVQVCRASGTSTGLTNLITNLAVDGARPPDGGTDTATKAVDYIRAWRQS